MRGRSTILAKRLLAIGRLAYARLPKSPRLTRTQWLALGYFAHANARSRTTSAFSLFAGSSLASASESISTLVRRGLLSRERCSNDRRMLRLDLTEQAKRIVSEDPVGDLVTAISSLETDEIERLDALSSKVLRALSGQQSRPAFGSCRFCRFCSLSSPATSLSAGTRCERFDEPVSDEDLDALCVGYEFR